MQCPKDRDVTLVEGELTRGLMVQGCPHCQGAWIRPEAYSEWRQRQPDAPADDADLLRVKVVPSQLPLDFVPSPTDAQAALCPDCRHYLVRGRLNLHNVSFFVERCPNCAGIWCDRGEWTVLEKLGLHTRIEAIFTESWQNQVKALEQVERERQATIDKLGPDLAERVFELADLLEKHPNGDFGVAYLMRRFEE